MGATIVIISGGIDLSVGSIYALAGVTMALVLRGMGAERGRAPCSSASPSASASASRAACSTALLVVGLRVHPFIITLGTMWVLRGIAFVASKAESILVPESLTAVAKAPLGLGARSIPVPMLVHDDRSRVLGAIYLSAR